MIVISLEHTQPKIRGYLTRHLSEVRPGVFVGNVSASRRGEIWAHITEEDPDVDAVLIYSQGKDLKYQIHGVPTRSIKDFEGMSLLTYEKKESPLYMRWLAKPDRTIYRHCIEVAWTCESLLRESIFRADLDILKDMTQMEEDKLISAICFLCAVHDVGKASVDFQKKIAVHCSDYPEELFKIIAPEGEIVDSERAGEFRHEIYSGDMLKKWLMSKGLTRGECRPYVNVVKSHHQGSTKGMVGENTYFESDEKWENEQVIPLINKMNDEYAFHKIPDCKDPNALFSMIEGFLIASDWIASGGLYDGTEDKEDALKKMHLHIKESGLLYEEAEDEYPFEKIFPFIKEPNELQKKIAEVLNEHKDYSLMLVNAPMGMGKTEAAMYTLLNSLKYRHKTSISVMMPTMATTDAIYGRIEDIQKNACIYPDAKPREFTGEAWMNSDEEDRRPWHEYGPMKRMQKIRVETIDQELGLAFLVRYGDLNKLIAGTSVAMIDELHAYDEYMMSGVREMLMWYEVYKIPTVALSATLPARTIRRLLKDVYSIKDFEPIADYPSITVVENGQVYQYGVRLPEGRVKGIEFVSGDHEQMLKMAIDSFKSGGCTCVYANTVKKAQNLIKALRGEIDRLDLDEAEKENVYLLTARTTPDLKKRKTEEILKKCGKDRACRPERLLVVSTQIMEASMDVDFDTVISELAPIDSILQRLGRFCRHSDKGTIREKGFVPKFYVVSPDALGKYDALPYLTGLLNATKEVLKRHSEFNYPGELPVLINEVYDNVDESWIESERIEYENRSDGKRLKGKISCIEDPGLEYKGYPNPDKGATISHAPTRDIEMPTCNLIIAPDDIYGRLKSREEFSRQECIDILRKYSVKVPEKDVADVKNCLSEDLPKWLNDCKVVRRSDGQFITDEEMDYIKV